MPLRCSLTTPVLFGGVPRALAIANGTLAAAVGIGFLQLRNIGRGRHSQAGVLNEEAGFSRSSFHVVSRQQTPAFHSTPPPGVWGTLRSEEHTSELQSLMRISYAVFCLKKKTSNHTTTTTSTAHTLTANRQ